MRREPWLGKQAIKLEKNLRVPYSCQAAASFCSYMDHSQVSEFCNEIKKREKKTDETD